MKLVFEYSFSAPREQLFRFHEQPQNLVRLQRRWPSFRLISHSGNIQPGSILKVQERIAFWWTDLWFEQLVFQPPFCFSEQMIRGPFRFFHHIHQFELDRKGTCLRDTLEFALPWYLGGALAERVFVAPALARWFAYRHSELTELIAEGALEDGST